LSDEAQQRRAASLRLVAAGISEHIDEIDQLVARGPEASQRIRAAPSDFLLLIAGGALLHAFYNELEKLFRLVAERIDGFEPGGEDWHARLAEQVFLEVPSLRPALLPEGLKAQTREFRGFRHLFRHLYSLDLESGRVLALLDAVPEYWRHACKALADFTRYLEQVASALEGGP
jgi:hypothetical protein